jgi:protein NRD1
MSPPQRTVMPAILPPQQPPQLPPQPAANPLAALAALLPQTQPYSPHHPQSNLSRQPAAAPAPAIDAQKLAIIQLLLQNGVPIEQITAILNAQQAAAQPPPPQHLQNQYPLSPSRGRPRSRSPPPRRRSPSRSLSPPPGRGRGRGARGRRREDFHSPPPQRRRRSPSYEEYRRPGSPSRSRSPPPPRRRSPPVRDRSPLRAPAAEPKEFKPRFIEWDDSLRPDRIRVLSRTLFVGGITSRIGEEKLREWFSRFGEVQSVILNTEKRCAFLKMYTRDGAVAAREGMEAFPADDTVIRVTNHRPFLFRCANLV